jgi:hypothetical protein
MNAEQNVPSAEQQPIQQPGPTTQPEQPRLTQETVREPAPDPAELPNDAPAEQVPPASDPAETTDAGDGAGDHPDADEQAAAGDVTEGQPEQHPASAGFGVTDKFVHDDEATPETEQEAGARDAGDQ